MEYLTRDDDAAEIAGFETRGAGYGVRITFVMQISGPFVVVYGAPRQPVLRAISRPSNHWTLTGAATIQTGVALIPASMYWGEVRAL